jgi:hypothetical protein
MKESKKSPHDEISAIEAFTITLQRYLILSKFSVDLTCILEDANERGDLLTDLRNVELEDLYQDGHPLVELNTIFCGMYVNVTKCVIHTPIIFFSTKYN